MCRFIYRCCWVWCICVFIVFQVSGQNLTWLRQDNPDNSDTHFGYSEVEYLARDTDGNLYNLIEYSSRAVMADDDDFDQLSRAGTSHIVAKYSTAGELLWYKEFQFLDRNAVFLDVLDDGSMILVGEVFATTDYDFVFEGKPFQLAQFSRASFFAWINADGVVTNWELSDEALLGFFNSSIRGIKLLANGKFWMSGIYDKGPHQIGSTLYLKHQISYVNLIGTDGLIEKSNEFDSGPQQNQTTKAFFTESFHTQNGQVFLKGFSKGFFNLSGFSSRFILRINAANEPELVMAVNNDDDEITEIEFHQDGTLSLLGYTPDGVLNTTMGNIAVGMAGRSFLVNLLGTSVQGIIPIPYLYLGMNKFGGDDNKLVLYGRLGTSRTVPDGQGNELPSDGERYIGFYDKAGVLSYFENYDYYSLFSNAELAGVLADTNCEAFYVAGFTRGVVDYDLSEDGERLSYDSQTREQYFLAKYNNEKPKILSDDLIEVCENDPLSLDLLIVDEASDQVTVTFSSPNGDFNPNLINLSGAGISRVADLSGLGVTGDVLLRVRATDICGDFNEKDVLVRIAATPDAPALSLAGDYYLCPGETLKITSDAIHQVTWSDNVTTTDTLEITTAGTYWVTQAIGAGCVSANSDSLTVIMAVTPERPVISASGSLQLCEGSSLTLSASLTNNLIWSTGETSASIEVTQPGSYTVYQTSEHCGNSPVSETVVVVRAEAPETPSISASGPLRFCRGESVTLTASVADNLVWSTGETTQSIVITEAGTYSVYQTSALCGDSNVSDMIEVEVVDLPETPVISVSGDLEVCIGETVTLTATPGDNVVWSTGETSPSITVSASGSYTVYQTSADCGDSPSATPVEVIVKDSPPQPQITVVGDARFCEGGSVVLRASEADTYLWSTGETTREVTVRNSGTFWLSSTVDGCESPVSDQVEVLVDEDFNLSLGADTSVCSAFNNIELVPEVSRSDLDFTWSDGSQMSTLIVEEAGEYWLEASNGTCVQRAMVRVEEACYPTLYFPNAFTPNGDGENDVFSAIGTRVVSFKLSVFNSWGLKIFESNSMDQGWDGTHQREKVPEGQYVYHAVYSGIVNGQTVTLSQRGGVLLFR